MPLSDQIEVIGIIVAAVLAVVAIGISIWAIVVSKRIAKRQQTDGAALSALQTKVYASMAAPRILLSWEKGTDHLLWLENRGHFDMFKVRLIATYLKTGSSAIRVPRDPIARLPAGQKEHFKGNGALPVRVVIDWVDHEGKDQHEAREFHG